MVADGSGPGHASEPGRAEADRPRADGGVVLILGAGPAGLTAAEEVLDRTHFRPVILEREPEVGGHCRTREFEGNRVDIGGHRFFSKSERVIRWWLDRAPLYPADGAVWAPSDPPPPLERCVFLQRRRRSRILFDGAWFDYPLRVSAGTLTGLGWRRSLRFGASYLKSVLRPERKPETLEAFFIRRFGRALYETFFKDYTQKVWGLPPSALSPDWGDHRVRGLSFGKALRHRLWRRIVPENLRDRRVEHSLQERFLYPPRGPGQFWDSVAARIRSRGGEIRLGWTATRLRRDGLGVREVEASDGQGARERWEPAAVLSSIPLQHLLSALDPVPPPPILSIVRSLPYRGLISAAFALARFELPAARNAPGGPPPDTWLYLQDGRFRAGRLQLYHHWSPFLPAEPGRPLVALEYFCSAGDAIDRLDDEAVLRMAGAELSALCGGAAPPVVASAVYRMPWAYPVYAGDYGRMETVRTFMDGIGNLFSIGRGGQHRYVNQDHAMLTAMAAVGRLAGDPGDRKGIWNVDDEA
jgi:protoporphyrinogen oxidase